MAIYDEEDEQKGEIRYGIIGQLGATCDRILGGQRCPYVDNGLCTDPLVPPRRDGKTPRLCRRDAVTILAEGVVIVNPPVESEGS